MPAYCFKCPECGRRETVVRTVAGRNEDLLCNDCDTDMLRDIGAEAGDFKDINGIWPKRSWAAGVPPAQIAEATRANRLWGDNVTYAPNGEAIFESRAQRKAHCQHQGFFDRSGGYGDA